MPKTYPVAKVADFWQVCESYTRQELGIRTHAQTWYMYRAGVTRASMQWALLYLCSFRDMRQVLGMKKQLLILNSQDTEHAMCALRPAVPVFDFKHSYILHSCLAAWLPHSGQDVCVLCWLCEMDDRDPKLVNFTVLSPKFISGRYV